MKASAMGTWRDPGRGCDSDKWRLLARTTFTRYTKADRRGVTSPSQGVRGGRIALGHVRGL